MSLPAWLSWADRQDWGRRGPAFRNDPVKLVLHSTEGAYWPTYSNGAVQPHLTIRWRGKSRRGFDVRQHQPLNVGARALSDSPAYPVNCMACIQVEIIGSCDKGYAARYGLLWLPGAGDEFLEDLGLFIRRLQRECGFRLEVTSEPWPDTNAAYPGAPQRMSLRRFERFHGVCGHTHVPANAHWDPGTTDVRRALALADRAEPRRASRDHDREPVKRKRGHHNGKLVVDGWAGPATVRELQHQLGTTVDGVISSQARRWRRSLRRWTTVKYSFRPRGSQCVRALQRVVGAESDGVFGRGTAVHLQRWLNKHCDAGLVVDGVAGRRTVRELQHALNGKRFQ